MKKPSSNRWGLVWCGLVLCGPLLAHAGPTSGFRGDGTNRYPDARVPASLNNSGPHVVWRVELAASSNATPIVLNGRICVTAEPTTLNCYDTTNGAHLWGATNGYEEVLTGAERRAFIDRLSHSDELRAELQTVQLSFSHLQRELRRSGAGPEVAQQLTEVTVKMDQLKSQLDDLERYLTTDDKDLIGYASATPTTNGEHIYALFGNGVVSKFTPDGVRVWSRWVGFAPQKMNGFHTGTAASPWVVGDRLLVPFSTLTVLDTASGERVWTDDRPYRDYGTPAVVDVDGIGVIFTSDGRMLRLDDGQALADGLGDIWYVGPVADGNHVYYAGGHSTVFNQSNGSTPVSAYHIERHHDQVRATLLWTVSLETRDVYYTSPVIHDGVLYTVQANTRIRALRTDTGELIYDHRLFKDTKGAAYPTPTVVDRTLFVSTDNGFHWALRSGPNFEVLDAVRMDGKIADIGQRSTPVAVGDHTYLHTSRHLYCLRASP